MFESESVLICRAQPYERDPTMLRVERERTREKAIERERERERKRAREKESERERGERVSERKRG